MIFVPHNRRNSIQEMSKCLASPAIEAGISIFFPCGVNGEGTRAKGASQQTLSIANTSSQHNRSPSLHIGSFSIRSIPVYTIKHTHDCTKSTSLQASNGQYGTSIHLLVRYASSSILRAPLKFCTQSILTILNLQSSTDPTSHCVLRHRRSLCGVEMASSYAAN
jgi:hypothetical protein